MNAHRIPCLVPPGRLISPLFGNRDEPDRQCNRKSPDRTPLAILWARRSRHRNSSAPDQHEAPPPGSGMKGENLPCCPSVNMRSASTATTRRRSLTSSYSERHQNPCWAYRRHARLHEPGAGAREGSRPPRGASATRIIRVVGVNMDKFRPSNHARIFTKAGYKIDISQG